MAGKPAEMFAFADEIHIKYQPVTVAHDASRPFRVQAGGSLTTALGTVFEVDLTGPAPIIHLVEGSVEVGATRGPASQCIIAKHDKRRRNANAVGQWS